MIGHEDYHEFYLKGGDKVICRRVDGRWRLSRILNPGGVYPAGIILIEGRDWRGWRNLRDAKRYARTH